MKSTYFLLGLVVLLVSCQPPAADDVLPESLEEKQQLLREKQADLKQLTDEIDALEQAIVAQDPNSRTRGALVTTTPVIREDFSRFVTIQGSVTADDFYDVTSEIGGRIVRLTVDEGENVVKGQLIAEIDPEAVEKQKAELAVSLELANTVYEKQKRLWDQNIGSEIQYLEAKNAKERLERNLELLDLQLSKTKVYAPVSGVVERLVLQSGELASPGMPIVQILNTRKLKVTAEVPENYISDVDRGERVVVEVPALNMQHTLPVSLIGRTIDPANRTFKVEVNLPNDRRLKPNLLAEMKIQDFSAEDVVTIPLDRVQQEVSGERYVFVTASTEEGTIAQKKVVEIGESYNGKVIITRGLEGNEQLIMEGARGLSDGQLIEITNEKTAAQNG